MTKTPVFSSEKLVKKQHARRFIMIGAAALILIAIVIGAVFLSKSCADRTHTEGGDLPFPYTWAEAPGGGVTLRISREGAEGRVWRVEDAGASFGAVTLSPAKQRSSDTEIKIAPANAGRAIIKLVLGDENGKARDSHEMDLLVEAYTEGKQLRCRVLSASCRAVQGDITAEEGDFPYRIHKDEDGDVVIAVDTAGFTDWECTSTNENAAELLGLVYENGAACAYLRAGSEPGTSEIVLKSSSEGKQLRAVIELSADGGFAVTERQTSLSEPTATPIPEPATQTPIGSEEAVPMTPLPSSYLTEETPAPTEEPAEETPEPTVEPEDRT